MAGDDIAAVLHAGFALEQRFNQIAHQSENFHQQGHHNPLPQMQSCLLEIRNIGKPDRKARRESTTAKETLPSFARRDFRRQFVLAKQRPENVRSRVRHPNQDEEGQHHHRLF